MKLAVITNSNILPTKKAHSFVLQYIKLQHQGSRFQRTTLITNTLCWSRACSLYPILTVRNEAMSFLQNLNNRSRISKLTIKKFEKL